MTNLHILQAFCTFATNFNQIDHEKVSFDDGDADRAGCYRMYLVQCYENHHDPKPVFHERRHYVYHRDKDDRDVRCAKERIWSIVFTFKLLLLL